MRHGARRTFAVGGRPRWQALVPGTPAQALYAFVRIRDGPGLDKREVGTLNPGEVVTELGRNEDGTWVRHPRGWSAVPMKSMCWPARRRGKPSCVKNRCPTAFRVALRVWQRHQTPGSFQRWVLIVDLIPT